MPHLLSRRRAAFLLAAAGLAAVPGGAGVAQAQDNVEGPGAVFTMTNNPTGNSITVFNRAADGTLTRAGDVATEGIGHRDGRGLGQRADPRQHRRCVLTDEHARTAKYLLALDGGSNSISLFRNAPSGLELVDREPSNGGRPISITVNRGVAYVLNAGTPRTGVGPQPSITGFTFDGQGQLTPIPGSTRPLSGIPNSGCTQVAFDKTGEIVIVEEQQADVITT